jgi:cellulose synthase/poly-beta-1,6-N-acetylglucosamine synthase-like glycosyltransferase
MHILVPLVYYLLMKNVEDKKPWNLSLDDKYQPMVTIIISTFNEAAVIVKRLQNLEKLDYPYDKAEIIVVDSASTDGTADIASQYVENQGFPFRINILRERERRGKAKALNLALQHAKGDVIATSDADSFWEPNALRIALSYMSSQEVGAVTGREVITNIDRSVYTRAENSYGKFNRTIRHGESKRGSTLMFQGELSLYRRSAFKKFEDEKGSDDIGTVIDIISKGYRTIFVPDAVFYNAAHYTLGGRMTVKIRRAQHLIYGITKAFALKLRREMNIPASTVFMNLYLYVINPFLGLLLFASLLLLALMYPLLFLLVFPVLVVGKFRTILISYATSHAALIAAVIKCAIGDRQTTWRKVNETRY